MEHARLLVSDLAAMSLLPFDTQGTWPRPSNWAEAAAVCRSLIVAASGAYKATRPPGGPDRGFQMGVGTPSSGVLEDGAHNPPREAYEEVAVASKSSDRDRDAAVSAELLQLLSADSTIKFIFKEHTRPSLFKSWQNPRLSNGTQRWQVSSCTL